MAARIPVRIRNQDFLYENSLVRIMANRNLQAVKLAGLDIGPFEEGNEYEVHYWVAQELKRAGIAHSREEEQLDTARLNKIQWTERIQTPGQISKLPDDFYPKLRRCLAELREGITNDPEKMHEYERAGHLTRDIINSRLKKIVSIASSPAQTESTLRNLTGEEKCLYDKLYGLINQWKTQILDGKEGA